MAPAAIARENENIVVVLVVVGPDPSGCVWLGKEKRYGFKYWRCSNRQAVLTGRQTEGNLMTKSVSDQTIRQEILRQVSNGRSVAPRDVAVAVAPEGEDWRRFLKRIRRVASELHAENLLVFLRKKKPVSPEGLKGVFRLAPPGILEAGNE